MALTIMYHVRAAAGWKPLWPSTGTMTLEERGAGGPAFDWPPLHGLGPIWTGRGFLVGGEARAVLDYEAGESGWSEELTRFHEEAAGEAHIPSTWHRGSGHARHCGAMSGPIDVTWSCWRSAVRAGFSCKS